MFRRQSTVLSLAYAHALILTNRPSLLSNFADLMRPARDEQLECEDQRRICIDAALLVVSTVNELVEEGTMYGSFWFTQYISFCAIATLFVYNIQKGPTRLATPLDSTEANSPSTKQNMRYFETAEKCQLLVAQATGNSSPNKRYNVILDELKRAVLGQAGSLRNRPVAVLDDRIVGEVSRDTRAIVGDETEVYEGSSQRFAMLHDYTGYSQGPQEDAFFNGMTSDGPFDHTNFRSTNQDFTGLFGMPLNSIGWLELDSWVSREQMYGAKSTHWLILAGNGLA